MPVPDTVLSALPADPTPDRGLFHRGGPLAAFVAISGVLATLGAALIIHREGASTWPVAGVAALAVATAWAGWCVLERWIHRAGLPRSHSVLAGCLGFELPFTCRDVAATVFFDPDSLQAGSRTRLLCFVENHAARQRVAHFRIGPHRELGLLETHTVALRLAPGQAAVYSLPLAIAPGLRDGEHDLPVCLRVKKPSGTGARLAGSRRHIFDVRRARFAAPFTVSRGEPGAPLPDLAREAGEARFLTLASVSEPGPRLEELETLLASRPPHA